MKNLLLLFAMLNLVQQPSFAQSQKKDSLLIVLKAAKKDTTTVKLLNRLASEYLTIAQYDSVLHYGKAALNLATVILNRERQPAVKNNIEREIAHAFSYLGLATREQGNHAEALSHFIKSLKIIERLGDKKDLASDLACIGITYADQGEYAKALEYHSRALEIYKELGKKSLVANELCNIGIVYWNKGDHSKALDYYLKALKIDEERGNKFNVAVDLGNIGVIYDEQGNYPKALEYYYKALEIDEQLGNKKGVSVNLGNIAVIYDLQGKSSEALEYHFKALKIDKELGRKYGIAKNYSNIGNIYHNEGSYSRALDYYLKALPIFEESGNQQGTAICLGNLGDLFTQQKKYAKAEEYLIKALKMDSLIGTLEGIKHRHQCLSNLYFAKGDYKKAYEHYTYYSSAKDSLFNAEKTEDITRKEMNFEFERKEQAAKLEQEKKEVMHQAEIQQQRTQRNGFIAGFGLMLAFAGVSYRSYRNKQKANHLLANKNAVIEEKQKEIIDSIKYAKRIQAAVLPPMRKVKENLPDSFILYKPKDIVAGDFYWLEEKDGRILFAAADCTGHGVPGAMVSVICNNGLNRAVREHGLTDPGNILDRTREIVIQEFEKSDEEVKDGMDISLCSLKGTQLQWAGANNPLWIIRKMVPDSLETPAAEALDTPATEDSEAPVAEALEAPVAKLIEIKPDKQPIGKYADSKSFTTHSIELQKGDIIYLFTDGYADQFGGEKGKKFKYAKLKELLLSIRDKSMEQQKEILHETFETWRGKLEQIDDVCMIGLRI